MINLEIYKNVSFFTSKRLQIFSRQVLAYQSELHISKSEWMCKYSYENGCSLYTNFVVPLVCIQ